MSILIRIIRLQETGKVPAILHNLVIPICLLTMTVKVLGFFQCVSYQEWNWTRTGVSSRREGNNSSIWICLNMAGNVSVKTIRILYWIYWGPWLTMKHNEILYMQYGAPGTGIQCLTDGVYVPIIRWEIYLPKSIIRCPYKPVVIWTVPDMEVPCLVLGAVLAFCFDVTLYQCELGTSPCMFPAGFDKDGIMYVDTVSETIPLCTCRTGQGWTVPWLDVVLVWQTGDGFYYKRRI